MKRYEKPFLTVARFTTQETIANSPYSEVTVKQEAVEGVGNVVVTSFQIDSFGANSNS